MQHSQHLQPRGPEWGPECSGALLVPSNTQQCIAMPCTAVAGQGTETGTRSDAVSTQCKGRVAVAGRCTQRPWQCNSFAKVGVGIMDGIPTGSSSITQTCVLAALLVSWPL
jgi:hypothetical protein